MIQTVQTAFGQTTGATLAVALPRPTFVGNALLVSLRFSPLTGTPEVTDAYANAFQRFGTQSFGAVAVALFVATMQRAGANHTITFTSQGGPQTLEASVCEMRSPASHRSQDGLSALLDATGETNALLTKTNEFLSRLCVAERA